MKKKATLTPSVRVRLEGLSLLLLIVAALVFFYASIATLYLFPVPDSFRWSGGESWMLLAWRNLIGHGQLTVPIALGSTLETPPGMLLGSEWVTALLYGLPQILFAPSTDPIMIGRTVSFVLAMASLGTIGWTAYRLHLPPATTFFAAVLLLATPSFTFASHSARYDMITGFAVVLYVSMFAVRADHRTPRGGRFALLFGLSTMIAAIVISPHLEVLLLPVSLYIAWYFGLLKSAKSVGFLVGWLVLGFGILALASIATTHHFALISRLDAANPFGAAFGNLSKGNLLSLQAQGHQLWMKGLYLWQEAPIFAIILLLILISEGALLSKKRPHASTLFLTICLGCAMFSALFLQAARPYHLIHVLPLIALVFAAHTGEWSKAEWLRPTTAILSVAITVVLVLLWIPQMHQAGRIGKRITEANTAAVQAAVEEESRNWGINEHYRPRFLAQGPAGHELLRDMSIRLMTESFLTYPASAEPFDSVLKKFGVDYIIDYGRLTTAEYKQTLQRASRVFVRSGTLLDRDVNYFGDTTSELDTLSLYAMKARQ
jgi:hypothetical protein